VTVGVVVLNQGTGIVTGTFDVDIYVDPSRTPILPGQPGVGTIGGSAPKQWRVDDMPPGTQITLTM